MSTIEALGVVAAALIGLAAAYQAALVLGLPLGEATMGGRAATVDGVLTGPYRLMAAASGVILTVAALVVLARAGVVDLGLPDPVVAVAIWVVVAFALLNTLTNLSGRHPLERWGMSALTLSIAALAGCIALAARPG